MSALAPEFRQPGLGLTAAAVPVAAAPEVALMRERLEVLRDVVISLGMQLVFRATILLRRWNY
jgi:hypothetical protein